MSFGRELYTIDWDGEKDEVVCGEKLCEVDSDPDISDNNFCDGKCDPAGRLWIGKKLLKSAAIAPIDLL